MSNNVYEEIFLKEKIVFLDVDDLFRRIKEIRQGYLLLEKGVQIVYKWYFFFQLSLLHKADYLKSAMWTYITSDEEFSINNYIKVIEKYEIFDERRNNLFKSKN